MRGGANLYAYGEGNPANARDPNGLKPDPITYIPPNAIPLPRCEGPSVYIDGAWVGNGACGLGWLDGLVGKAKYPMDWSPPTQVEIDAARERALANLLACLGNASCAVGIEDGRLQADRRPWFIWPGYPEDKTFLICPAIVTGLFEAVRMRRGDGALFLAELDVQVNRVFIEGAIGFYQGRISAVSTDPNIQDWWSGSVRGTADCVTGRAVLHGVGP